jgi:hypothetical protein
MNLPGGFIGPRRPWHIAEGITPQQMAANLAAARAPESGRDRAKQVWWDEFSRARDAGFTPDREFRRTDGSTYKIDASAIAAAEVRLASRKLDGERTAAPAARPADRVPHAGFRLVYDGATDRYRMTDWVRPHEHGFSPASAFDPAREAEHARFAEAEKQFAQSVEEETGNGVSFEEWSERKEARETMRKQSHDIAARLEAGGTIAYRSDEYQLLIWHVFSQEAETVPAFRRLCFIPQVAAMVRAQKLAALEHFLDCNPYCRFWTFTSGPRVPLSGLHDRIVSLHSRLNVLNKELRRRYACELVFRSTELGTIETKETAGKAKALRAARFAHKAEVEKAIAAGRPIPVWTRAKQTQYDDPAGSIERDETTGELCFHPHAHCVLKMPHRLAPEVWSEMLRFVWDHWGDHWDDAKIIEDAREAVKYCLKPGDVADLAPADLCALEKAIRGLRLVTPMGVLKKEIRARKERGETLRRVRTPDGMVWKVVLDHNKQLSTTEEARDQVRRMKRQEFLDRADVAAGRAHSGAPLRKSVANLCRVVARLSPAAGVSPIKEPRVIVMASRGGFDASAVRNHPLTVKLWNQGIQAWSAGRAIRVHTGTPTGETRPLVLLADTDERHAPATEPVWEASIPATCAGLN